MQRTKWFSACREHNGFQQVENQVVFDMLKLENQIVFDMLRTKCLRQVKNQVILNALGAKRSKKAIWINWSSSY